MGVVPTPKSSLDRSKPWGQHLRGDSSGIPPSRMPRGLQWGTPHAPHGRGRGAHPKVQEAQEARWLPGCKGLGWRTCCLFI